jgi:TonB family protein
VTDAIFTALASYSVQMLLLIVAAAAAARLCPVGSARGRLLYWRLVVGGCLGLPALSSLAETDPVRVRALGFETVSVFATAGRSEVAGLSVGLLILAGVALGAATRAVWLGWGLAHLARLRASASALPLPPPLEDLQQSLAPRATIAVQEDVHQPVTFGVVHPVVIVPPRFPTLSEQTQRAVLCHELLHVRGRDWCWLLAEEMLVTAFWFHPALRWAVGQVQQSREETIDALVVAITGARREYMSALMAFADAPAVHPAAPFVRRGHMSLRLRRLAKEVRMSRTRTVIAAAALAATLSVSTAFLAAALPLYAAQAQRLRVGGVVKPPTKVHDVKPVYPEEAKTAKIEGIVILEVVIGVAGDVIEMSVSRSVPELDEAAKDAVGQWLFEPTLLNGEAVEVEMAIMINFTLK